MPSSLSALLATFTTATARALGVHPRVLYAWRDGGAVVELVARDVPALRR